MSRPRCSVKRPHDMDSRSRTFVNVLAVGDVIAAHEVFDSEVVGDVEPGAHLGLYSDHDPNHARDVALHAASISDWAIGNLVLAGLDRRTVGRPGLGEADPPNQMTPTS